MLEGGPLPESNQDFFQSALQTTIEILDSIIYLISIYHVLHTVYIKLLAHCVIC